MLTLRILIMEKPVAAIEFGSKKLKLVIGYEVDGQVYVVYSLTKPYGHVLELGNFNDPEKVTQAVRDIKNFSDPSAKLNLNINEAVLSLPPFGLDVYQTRQVTTVISEESKISNLEIKNIYALIRNGSNSLRNELIDIIPEYYVLDQGRTFVRPPLGESSSTLTVSAKVHTLPSHISHNFQSALGSGNMLVKKAIVAPFAASQILATYQNVPNDYLLVDIGSNVTTVSLIGGQQLFASRFFEWGGDRITEKIIERFNINENEAEKIKITYGLCYRQMNFKAPVCHTQDEDGNIVKHYEDELNVLIKGELDNFVKQLNSAISSLLESYDPSYRSLPMILIGGGAALNGLVEYLTPKVQSDTVTHIAPRSLGARDGTFFNCLGMILACNRYPNVYDETHPKMGPLTRENTSK